MSKIAAFVIGATLLFLGYLMPKATRNSAFGVLPAVDPEKRCRVAERPALRRAHVHPRRHPHDRLRHPLRRRSRIRRHHGRFAAWALISIIGSYFVCKDIDD